MKPNLEVKGHRVTVHAVQKYIPILGVQPLDRPLLARLDRVIADRKQG
jgi:hypothetical protein